MARPHLITVINQINTPHFPYNVHKIRHRGNLHFERFGSLKKCPGRFLHHGYNLGFYSVVLMLFLHAVVRFVKTSSSGKQTSIQICICLTVQWSHWPYFFHIYLLNTSTNEDWKQTHKKMFWLLWELFLFVLALFAPLWKGVSSLSNPTPLTCWGYCNWLNSLNQWVQDLRLSLTPTHDVPAAWIQQMCLSVMLFSGGAKMKLV